MGISFLNSNWTVKLRGSSPSHLHSGEVVPSRPRCLLSRPRGRGSLRRRAVPARPSPPAAPLTRVQKLSRLDRSPRPPTLSFSLSLFLCTNSFCTLALPKKKKKSPLNDKVTCTFFFTRGRNSVLATAGKSTAFHKDVACVLLHRGLKQSAGCAQIFYVKGHVMT